MMIRSPLGVYWSDTHEVQIGLDPRVALRLAGLSVAEQQAVSSLASVGTESEFLDACERRAVGEKRARSLLGTLRNSGLLDTSPPCFPDLTWRTVFVERLDALAVEICTVLAAGGLGYILTSDTSRPHGTDHPIFRRPSWRTFTRHQALQSYFASVAGELRSSRLMRGPVRSRRWEWNGPPGTQIAGQPPGTQIARSPDRSRRPRDAVGQISRW